MNITLPDGSVVNTDNIKRVSSIRDEGLDETTIDRSILMFDLIVTGKQIGRAHV